MNTLITWNIFLGSARRVMSKKERLALKTKSLTFLSNDKERRVILKVHFDISLYRSVAGGSKIQKIFHYLQVSLDFFHGTLAFNNKIYFQILWNQQ